MLIIYLLNWVFCLFHRDHFFDKKERIRRKRPQKLGTVLKPDEPSRGSVPVGYWYRVNESKILPHKRLGIDLICDCKLAVQLFFILHCVHFINFIIKAGQLLQVLIPGGFTILLALVLIPKSDVQFLSFNVALVIGLVLTICGIPVINFCLIGLSGLSYTRVTVA